MSKLGTQIFAQAFEKRGIKLRPKQIRELQAKLRGPIVDLSSVRFNLSSRQMSALTENERTRGSINLDLEVEEMSARLEKELPALVPILVQSISESLYRDLRRKMPSILGEVRRERQGFERRMAEKWEPAIKLQDFLREMAVEAGVDCIRSIRANAEDHPPHVLEVVTRLHARSCQIVSEIIVLLRTGHADGAHARWRSLHEIAVTAFFIRSHGDDVAERYLLHEGVESFKAASQYTRYYDELGVEPLGDAEWADLKGRYESVLLRYGNAYGEKYGWASAALNNRNPSFAEIERAAGLSYLGPYYKWASYNVHATPKGVFVKLGLLPEEKILLAGPSNLGLTDPAQLAALSLTQITTTLLTIVPNIDRLVMCEVLRKFGGGIGEAFFKVQQEIERSGRKQLARRRKKEQARKSPPLKTPRSAGEEAQELREEREGKRTKRRSRAKLPRG